VRGNLSIFIRVWEAYLSSVSDNEKEVLVVSTVFRCFSTYPAACVDVEGVALQLQRCTRFVRFVFELSASAHEARAFSFGHRDGTNGNSSSGLDPRHNGYTA